jgi:hypothetical protein
MTASEAFSSRGSEHELFLAKKGETESAKSFFKDVRRVFKPTRSGQFMTEIRPSTKVITQIPLSSFCEPKKTADKTSNAELPGKS